jgi:hypothetical protein
MIQECHPFKSGFIGERSPSSDIKLLEKGLRLV